MVGAEERAKKSSNSLCAPLRARPLQPREAVLRGRQSDSRRPPRAVLQDKQNISATATVGRVLQVTGLDGGHLSGGHGYRPGLSTRLGLQEEEANGSPVPPPTPSMFVLSPSHLQLSPLPLRFQVC